MTLVKATIEILDAELRGGTLPGVIPIQFNPTEVSLTKRAEFAEISFPGLDAPLLQYVKGGAETLALELFCDTTKSGMGADAEDVRAFTEPLHQLVKVQPETHAPPRIRFSWGQGLAFKAVVTDIQQTFTMFSPSGVPLRATVKLTLKEFTTLKEQLAGETPARAPSGGPKPKREDAGRVEAKEAEGASVQGIEDIEVYTPTIELALEGVPLDAVFGRDILQAVFRDSLEAADEFELTISNWDEERREFKYDDASPFEPGKKIELKLGYRGKSPLTSMVTGTIEALRQDFPAGGGPTLLVAGVGAEGKARRRPTKPGKPVHTLSYGRSLIEFVPNLTMARQVGGKTTGKTTKRRRPVHEVTATGLTIGLPDLRVGTVIEIEGLGKRFSGPYFVTATTHSISSDGYKTGFECRKDVSSR